MDPSEEPYRRRDAGGGGLDDEDGFGGIAADSVYSDDDPEDKFENSILFPKSPVEVSFLFFSFFSLFCLCLFLCFLWLDLMDPSEEPYRRRDAGGGGLDDEDGFGGIAADSVYSDDDPEDDLPRLPIADPLQLSPLSQPVPRRSPKAVRGRRRVVRSSRSPQKETVVSPPSFLRREEVERRKLEKVKIGIQSRKRATEVLSRAMQDRELTKASREDEKERFRRLREHRKREWEVQARKEMERSPFRVDLLAENERISEESKVRVTDRQRRMKKMEHQRERIRNEIVMKTLLEEQKRQKSPAKRR
eukprot:TRINITY_DN70248_c0_g1_i1.p1 TRINITY_DN70248_c0_g1~~TRINITY_DN70248_c0_g1_i1.p1  ORF type:complete len:343 (-),score=95.80 TRINITY_DN70248_c0_g1_i1:236-1147(-)